MSPGKDCLAPPFNCHRGPARSWLIGALVCQTVVYCLVYLGYTYRTFQGLQAKPYAQFRMANLLERLQVRGACTSKQILVFMPSVHRLALQDRDCRLG